MMSDMFRSLCWSRKCLVRLPQYRELHYKGLITSPDPVPNRQKITRLCYDFCVVWGQQILGRIFILPLRKKPSCRPESLFPTSIVIVGNKIRKVDTFFCFLSIFIFAQKLRSPWRSDSEAPNSIFIYAKGVKKSNATFHFCFWQLLLLTIFLPS